ncbi:hypothetical protein [Mastigocladopsis repens]|uniref:hypothetical protein n=1 Tax=Mastigocladopsis repens TaxID=221287 RepID=UPI0012E99E45|nr:hypothetical protein [Mastigocladopsis repens]
MTEYFQLYIFTIRDFLQKSSLKIFGTTDEQRTLAISCPEAASTPVASVVGNPP